MKDIWMEKAKDILKDILVKRGLEVCDDNHYVVSLNFRDIQLLRDAIATALQEVARERDEEIESLEYSLQALAEKMVYRGNSVGFIYDKKEVYSKIIDRVFGVMKEFGVVPDGETDIADLLRKQLSEKEAKIEDLERALRIESQEPMERSQEANHYNWLEDKQEKLEARINELEACCDMSTPLGMLPINSIGMRKIVDYSVSLEQKLEKAVGALNSFQRWFASLPEDKTLFTEGWNKIQDSLIEVFKIQFNALKELSEDKNG